MQPKPMSALLLRKNCLIYKVASYNPQAGRVPPGTHFAKHRSSQLPTHGLIRKARVLHHGATTVLETGKGEREIVVGITRGCPCIPSLDPHYNLWSNYVFIPMLQVRKPWPREVK